MAIFAPSARDDKLFSATSSSSSFTPPPDFINAMKQFTLSSPCTFDFSKPSSFTPPPDFTSAMKQFTPSSPCTFDFSKVATPAPAPTCEDKLFSATPSSSSSYKPTPPDFISAMIQKTPSSSPSTFSFSPPNSHERPLAIFATPTHYDNTFTFSATSVDVDRMKIKDCRRIYDDFNPFCERPEFVVPPHIKESCDLALEKYNNEKDTNYRYVCPLFAQEDTKAHVTTHYFLFQAASDSHPYRKSFEAIFISVFRYSDGNKPSVKDLRQVSPFHVKG